MVLKVSYEQALQAAIDLYGEYYVYGISDKALQELLDNAFNVGQFKYAIKFPVKLEAKSK